MAAHPADGPTEGGDNSARLEIGPSAEAGHRRTQTPTNYPGRRVHPLEAKLTQPGATVINVVEISGTLTTDPTLADVGAGSLRADFTVAVPNVRYDRRTNTDVIDTAFIRVVSWEKPAEVAAALHRGCVVWVRGELTQEEVTDPRGRKERKTKVRAAVVSVIRVAEPPAPAADDYPTF
jgi:hypothetical protein